MNNKMDEAKSIFIKYNGSHYFMWHEGIYEKYKEFNVTNQQEMIWINEIQSESILKIENGSLDAEYIVLCFFTILSTVRQYKNIEILTNIIRIYKKTEQKLDSFSKVLIAEDILETIKSLCYDNKLRDNSSIENLRILGVNILNDVMKNPISIDHTYRKKSYLKYVIEESSISKRIKKTLNEWDKLE